jgi:hypothetical protein
MYIKNKQIKLAINYIFKKAPFRPFIKHLDKNRKIGTVLFRPSTFLFRSLFNYAAEISASWPLLESAQLAEEAALSPASFAARTLIGPRLRSGGPILQSLASTLLLAFRYFTIEIKVGFLAFCKEISSTLAKNTLSGLVGLY